MNDFFSITGLDLIIPTGAFSPSSPSSSSLHDDSDLVSSFSGKHKTLATDVLLAKGLLLNVSNKIRGHEQRPYKCALVAEHHNSNSNDNDPSVSYFLVLLPSSASPSRGSNDHIFIPMHSKMSIIPSFLSQHKLDDNNSYDYYSNNKIELSNGDGKSIVLIFEKDDDDPPNASPLSTSSYSAADMQGKWHKVLKDVLLELIFKEAFVHGQGNRISIRGMEDVIHRAKKIVHVRHCHLTRARFIRDNKVKVQIMLMKLLDDNGDLLVSKEGAEELLQICSVDSLLSSDSDILALRAAVPYLYTTKEIDSRIDDHPTTDDAEAHEDIHHRAITLALSPSSSKLDFSSSSLKRTLTPSYSY
jgi:hypothetical protein